MMKKNMLNKRLTSNNNKSQIKINKNRHKKKNNLVIYFLFMTFKHLFKKLNKLIAILRHF